MMTNRSPEVRLGDLTTKITKGTTPKSFIERDASGGINFIKVESIGSDGRLIPAKFARIDAATNVLLARSVLQEDDILFTIAGTIGRVARVTNDYLPANTNQAVAIVRPNRELVDAGYLTCVLGDGVRVRQAQSRVVQSVQANFSLGELSELQIPFPSLDEQRRIAGVLGALDYLIEVNSKLALECDNLAQALWQRTVRDIVTTSKLSEHASVVLGGTPSRAQPGFWGGDVPWINSGKANEFRVLTPSEYITRLGQERSSTKLMPAGTTIVAITGATLGQISRLEIDACGNQSLVGVYSVEPAARDFLYFAVRDQIDFLLRSATGGAQQHVNKSNVEELQIRWPSEADLQAWHQSAGPLLSAGAHLLIEAAEAKATRDELLPLLISGRVIAKDVSE